MRYSTVCRPYVDTVVSRFFKVVKKEALLYKKDDECFVDLESKTKYEFDLDDAEMGQIIVDPRTLISVCSIGLPITNMPKRTLFKAFKASKR